MIIVQRPEKNEPGAILLGIASVTVKRKKVLMMLIARVLNMQQTRFRVTQVSQRELAAAILLRTIEMQQRQVFNLSTFF